MKKLIYLTIVLCTLGGLGFLIFSYLQHKRSILEHSDIAKRQAAFKKLVAPVELLYKPSRSDITSGKLLKNLNKFLDLKDVPWQYFSKETHEIDTKAKPEIWTQPEKWKKRKEDFFRVVREYENLAKHPEDGKEYISRLHELGKKIENSCTACHDDFRSKTPIKI